MMNRTHSFLSIVALVAFALTAYRFTLADEVAAPGTVDSIIRFTDTSCLVVFDLGSEGVKRMVLVDADVIKIGGKRFLRGRVTDKFPKFPVVVPSKGAYIAMDRVVSIQILDAPKP